MRFYSVERVREDFRIPRDRYDVHTMIIDDDHLMGDKQRVYELIDVLRELDLKPFFPNSLALYALDRQILEALKSIGLTQLVLSIESGSEKVLKKIMHKPLNLSIVNRVVEDCRDLGIATDVAILIGLPGETKRDIEDTRRFLRTIKANWFRINVATPLIGSELYEICEKNGYLKGNFIDCDYKRATIETEDFTADYIQNKAYSLNLELNFVNNSDFLLGNYEFALMGFNNTLRAKQDHAFALYYAAECHKILGNSAEFQDCKRKYNELASTSAFWQEYIDQFGLEKKSCSRVLSW